LAVRIGPRIALAGRSLSNGRTDRLSRAGLLNLGEPGAGGVQAVKYFDRPLVRGQYRKLSSKAATVGGNDEGDGAATVGIATESLDQPQDVLRSKVEGRACDLDDLGESTDPCFGKPLRRVAHFVSGELTPGHDRHQPMKGRNLDIDGNTALQHAA
jgi:hypothetical protein